MAATDFPTNRGGDGLNCVLNWHRKDFFFRGDIGMNDQYKVLCGSFRLQSVKTKVPRRLMVAAFDLIVAISFKLTQRSS